MCLLSLIMVKSASWVLKKSLYMLISFSHSSLLWSAFASQTMSIRPTCYAVLVILCLYGLLPTLEKQTSKMYSSEPI